MKYGIIDNQSKKFLLVSEDLGYLRNTIKKHMPQFCADDIKEYADSDVEQAYDGSYYLKGDVIQPTIEEVQNRRRQYRFENCDYLTLEKIRKTSLGCWTVEDEDAYVKNMQEIDVYLAQHLAYPKQSGNGSSDNEMLIVPHMGIDV